MKVKILKSSETLFWYSDHIGETFNVLNKEQVLKDPKYGLVLDIILKEDLLVVETPYNEISTVYKSDVEVIS